MEKRKGKGKLSREGQALRRQRIVDFIREAGKGQTVGVKSREICDALGISRSSLSDDIRAINRQGEILVSPRGGYYAFNENCQDRQVRSFIDKQVLRRWFILALLSEASMEFQELLEALRESGIMCGVSTLHADLSVLKKDGYVSAATVNGTVLYRSETIYCTDSEEIRRYRNSGKKAGVSSRMRFEASEALEEKLRHILPVEDMVSAGAHTRSGGRKNLLTNSQMNSLEVLEKLPYRERRLRVTFRTKTEKEMSIELAVGMVVYSIETSRIYLLGKTDAGLFSVPLDRVDFEKTGVVREGALYNYSYGSREFAELYRQMLNVSTDEPVFVKVRFANLPYVREKVERLQKSRSRSAIISDCEDPSEFVYTDTVRGLNDFARIIRRFGRAAIAEEPKELKEMLIRTSELVNRLYEAENK